MRKLVWVFVLLFFSSFLLGSLLGYHLKKFESRVSCLGVVGDALELTPEELPPYPESEKEASGEEVSYQIRPGDNLYKILHQFGVSKQLIVEWKKRARPIYNLSLVHPGQGFWLRYDAQGDLYQFELEVGEGKSLLITRQEESWQAEMTRQGKELPPPSYSFYQGKVKDNFYLAGREAGMSPSLIMELVDIFATQIDFSLQIRKGDSFYILTEKRGKNQEKVLVAEIEAGGSWHRAYYFEDEKGGGYYDEKGNSLRGFYLIKPVPGARITSGYTYRRYHPILRCWRPHLAVDYAAPLGTPVRAAADGVVVYAGWYGSYGKYIAIRHNSVYSTTYGHLHKIARGIRKGVRVRQGQVIGYVGKTGLATGPHLCYRVIKNGRSINPLKFKGEKGGRVKDYQRFVQDKKMLEAKFAEFKQTALAQKVPPSLSTSLAVGH